MKTLSELTTQDIIDSQRKLLPEGDWEAYSQSERDSFALQITQDVDFLVQAGMMLPQLFALSESGMDLDGLAGRVNNGESIAEAIVAETEAMMQHDTQPPVPQQESAEAAKLREQIAKLQAENSRLKNRPTAKLSHKISEKGALSVYGLGRFPVTLYKEQWRRLIDDIPAIAVFLDENDSRLASKENKT